MNLTDWEEYVYDSDDRLLRKSYSNGYWEERTYDDNGYLLTIKDSYGKDQVVTQTFIN